MLKIKNFFVDHKKLICPLSRSKNFEHLFSIKKFTIYMCTVKNKKNYEFKKMNFFINKISGSVQIFPRVSLKKLYFKSHSSGKIGKVWSLHHKMFYNFLNIKSQKNIIEIGGGHNSVGSKELLKNKKVSLISFDPNGQTIKNSNFKLIKEFFSESLLKKYKLNNKFDLAIHSHLFEHIYDPKIFLNAINASLKTNGLHVFAVPNMEPMIKNRIASAMNFEHPFFLNEKLISALLKKTGFKILSKKYYGKYHSIFYKTKKIKNIKEKNPLNSYKKNKKIFIDFAEGYRGDVQNINLKIKDKESTFLFGAHIFSQMLIFNGLEKKSILSVLDNDPKKQGEFLYGTNYKVFSPKILKKHKNPTVILRAGEYNAEIKKNILKKINANTNFI
jgi:SAM-dependent methyltransferase